MRGIIEIDCKCQCEHKQSDHVNGRINTNCTAQNCHCSTFVAAPLRLIHEGKFVKVAWVES